MLARAPSSLAQGPITMDLGISIFVISVPGIMCSLEKLGLVDQN